jgi:hypothetical protein
LIRSHSQASNRLIYIEFYCARKFEEVRQSAMKNARPKARAKMLVAPRIHRRCK